MSFLYPERVHDKPLPEFKTLDEWEAKKSTKLDALARICAHYLSRDDAPHVSFADGRLVIPAMPPLEPGKVITKKRRICVYLEFVHFRPLIMQVNQFMPFTPKLLTNY